MIDPIFAFILVAFLATPAVLGSSQDKDPFWYVFDHVAGAVMALAAAWLFFHAGIVLVTSNRPEAAWFAGAVFGISLWNFGMIVSKAALGLLAEVLKPVERRLLLRLAQRKAS